MQLFDEVCGIRNKFQGPLTLTCIRITLKIGLMIGTRQEISTYADVCKSENSNHVAEITI
jgi:hypothetical protein